MLLLTIALATTLSEASEGDIENHLNLGPDAKLALRHLIAGELTRHLIAIEVIPAGEEVVVPFVSLTNVEGFGAHD
jgi:hypothetical protein